MKEEHIVVVDDMKIGVTDIEARIIVYLYNVPDTLKSTKQINQKFIETHRNYAHFCVILRTMKLKKLISDHFIRSRKEKIWNLRKENKEKVYKIALKVIENSVK